MTIDTPLCFVVGLIIGIVYNIIPELWVLVIGFIAFSLLCVVLARVRMREIRMEKIRKMFEF